MSAPYRFLLACGTVLLGFWATSRALLLTIYSDRWTAPNLPDLLLAGLRVDLIGVGVLLALPALLWPLLSLRSTRPIWWYASRAWVGVIALIAMVLEVATPTFLDQYESRPNHLAVEYLRDWTSVLPMLWVGFKLPLGAVVATFAFGLYGLWRWTAKGAPPQSNSGVLAILGLWPVLIAADVLLIRNSLEHRPANPAMFARWPDRLLNEVVLNSAYSFGYATYALRHERSAADVYGDLSDDEMRREIASDSRFSGAPTELPTLHKIVPTATRGKPLNLILVVEESLGADFSGRLGGRGLTPELDRWSHQGIWFERLYATGTRSARGLEAIVAGFPPSPAPAVLKRQAAQSGFATLASRLGSKGYTSRFIYGGAAHFDNMRGFFAGNGFGKVIEKRDFVNPRHVSSWGVSDEDLFDRTLSETSSAYANGEPFFHLAFTSSHHEPFDVPDHRLEDGSDAPGTADGAVRYADWALGQFLDSASKQAWFRDTLILVIADHDIRVYGDTVIPLRRFQIPGLIVGADVEPMRVGNVASQIDIAPTLLSLMGVAVDVPFPGYDLTRTLPEFGNVARASSRPRALIQFDDRFALLLDDELQVLHPGGAAQRFKVTGQGASSVEAHRLAESEYRFLKSQALLGDWLYRNQAYRID